MGGFKEDVGDRRACGIRENLSAATFFHWEKSAEGECMAGKARADEGVKNG